MKIYKAVRDRVIKEFLSGTSVRGCIDVELSLRDGYDVEQIIRDEMNSRGSQLTRNRVRRRPRKRSV